VVWQSIAAFQIGQILAAWEPDPETLYRPNRSSATTSTENSLHKVEVIDGDDVRLSMSMPATVSTG
jgi:hypothetical protein